MRILSHGTQSSGFDVGTLLLVAVAVAVLGIAGYLLWRRRARRGA